jgi:tetratricopeptide (TPR) repeat protein
MRVGPLLGAAALGVGIFVVYARGACPTIYVGDSGELVTAVHLLGIPHPTGYPLYVLLGKVWTLLVPVGSVAYRMSLFSAAAGAAACAGLYALGRALALRPVAAAVAALALAFAPSFWGEANVQRVYTLGALSIVAATAAAWRWWRRRDARSLALAFLVCGLGASVHAYLVVYAAALALCALVTEPGLARRGRALAAAGAAFGVGLVPYLYLPWRSRADPALDWGDPETPRRFLEVVVRRDFWPRAWIEGPGDVLVVVADWLRSFPAELTWAGAVLGVVGLAVGWRRHRGFTVLLVLAMLGNVAALALHGSRTDLFVWHRYYIPSYALAALLAGIGCEALLARLARPLAVVALAIPAALLVGGFPDFDRSRYRVAEEFSLAVLRSLPPGAHLVATDDNVLFVLMYLQLVEGHRPDVNLVLQGVGEARLPPLRFDAETERLFFTHHPNWRLPELEIVPRGLVFEARRRGGEVPAAVVPAVALAGEEDPRVPKDHLTQNLIGHFHYMLGVTLEGGDWLRARREFAAAARAAPGNDVLFYNLGLVFARGGLFDDALAAFRRAHEINPRHLASADRPRAADRIAEVAAERERVARLEGELAAAEGLASVGPGTAEYHRRLAELLEARGETTAARGQRLRLLELESAA